jgi:hypothetical protein
MSSINHKPSKGVSLQRRLHRRAGVSLAAPNPPSHPLQCTASPVAGPVICSSTTASSTHPGPRSGLVFQNPHLEQPLRGVRLGVFAVEIDQ